MFNKATKKEKYLIFNINSTAVSGALVYFNSEKNMPSIEYSIQSEISISKHSSARDFKENSKSALEKVLALLSNYINIAGGVSKINAAFVFGSSPWTRKNIHNLVDERIEKFTVTDQYLENFLKNGGQIKDDEDLLRAEIVSLKANGYNLSIGDIVNKEITKLDISLLDSYINKKDKESIERIIKKTFVFLDISFSAFLPVLFSQIKKIYDISDDFAFMDFTGEVMEFGMYMDGEIKSIFSVQTGKNKIIRDLVSVEMAKDFTDAKYMLTLYLQGQLDEKIHKKVSILVEKNINEITKKIEKEFSHYKNFHIPKKVFIVSSGEMNYLLKDFSLFKEKYFVGKTLLKNFADSDEEKYFDNFLALEAEYIFEN